MDLHLNDPALQAYKKNAVDTYGTPVPPGYTPPASQNAYGVLGLNNPAQRQYMQAALNGPYATSTTPTGIPLPAAGARPQAPGEGYGPGFGETYGKSHIGAYDQPTMLETFAQQQMQGNNPYYDRLRQQQEASINQQMAARGHYNSGGALAALGNADAALYADQFQNMGNLAGQASNLSLNRTGAGMNAASGIQGLQQGRLGQQFGEASQIAQLGAGLYGGFYGQGGQQSGDAAMSGINAGANAAALQGQGQMARLNTVMDTTKAYYGSK